MARQQQLTGKTFADGDTVKGPLWRHFGLTYTATYVAILLVHTVPVMPDKHGWKVSPATEHRLTHRDETQTQSATTFKAQNAGFEHRSTAPFSAGSAAGPRELYVAPVAVNDEERNDVRWCLLDTRLQRSVNPCNHHPLDHPCCCLIMILMIGANVTNSFVAILPSS